MRVGGGYEFGLVMGISGICFLPNSVGNKTLFSIKTGDALLTSL